MHWLRRATVAAVVTAALALAAPAHAQTGERILSYDVDLRIEPSGSLLVTEWIVYDFGDAERHGIFRDLPVRVRYDGRYDRVYPVDVLEVSGPGTSDQYELENVGAELRIRIGDPDRTVSGQHDYTIVYRIRGVLNGFSDHDELYWNAIGTQWAVPVEQASARVSAPAAISRVACYVGPVGSTTPCDSSETEGSAASFIASRLDPSEGLTLVVSLPTGTVPAPQPVLDERWTLVRAFSITPGTLAAAGAVLLLVLLGLGWLARVVGGDRRASAGTAQTTGAAVEWAPPDDIRPGQAGPSQRPALFAERKVLRAIRPRPPGHVPGCPAAALVRSSA